MDRNYKFGFLHYWNYFKINYIISLKALFEYKSNLSAGFIAVLFFDIAFLLFGFIFKDFLKLINWSFVDYVIYLLFIHLSYNFAGQFLINKELNIYLPKGFLNKYLCRPGNGFFNYFFDLQANWIIFTIVNIFIFCPFILFFGNISFEYFYLILLVFLFNTIFIAFLLQFVNSFSFYFLKSSASVIFLYDSIDRIFQSYTPLFFDKSNFNILIFIYHSFFVAVLIVPLFKGIIPINFYFYFFILVFFTFLLIFLTLISWHYGLEKYEAYN